MIINVKVIHVSTVGFVLFVCFFALVHPDKAFKDDSTSTRTEQNRAGKKRDFSDCVLVTFLIN